MKRALAVVCVVAVCLASADVGRAGTKTYETDVSRDPYWRSGEPSVAVNARDPRNLVFASTQLMAYPLVAQQRIQPQEQLVDHFIFRCQIAVSFDRGGTWRRRLFGVDPVKAVCGDVVTASAPDGTLYVAAVRMDRALNAEAIVARSSDRGVTWSEPAPAMNGLSIVGNLQEGDAYPLPGPSSPGDRPFLHVDQVTGTVYVTANANPLSVPGILLGITSEAFLGEERPARLPSVAHRYIAASRDKTRTWTPPRPLDSAEYPEGGHWPGPAIDAAFGTVAASYTLDYGSSPPGIEARCCGVFQVSSDDGATWRRHVTRFPGGIVAADPTRRGRFAVLVHTETKLMVYTTADSGATWSPPVSIAERPPNARVHPWLGYGRNGVLGAVWRTVYDDETYAQWGSVSFDGGATFRRPIMISSRRSPPSVAPGPGDDCACNGLSLDDHYLHTGWAEERNDNTDTWYGRYKYK